MSHSSQEKQTQYALEHIERKRQRAISYLGGKCAICERDDGLEFDHVDPEQKCFTISSNLSRSWESLVVELDKCQLLCWSHHRIKTLGYVFPPEHGVARYKSRSNPCRCDVCREETRKYKANLRQQRNIAGLRSLVTSLGS